MLLKHSILSRDFAQPAFCTTISKKRLTMSDVADRDDSTRLHEARSEKTLGITVVGDHLECN